MRQGDFYRIAVTYANGALTEDHRFTFAQSGDFKATLAGTGGVDVESGSRLICLRDLRASYREAAEDQIVAHGCCAR